MHIGLNDGGMAFNGGVGNCECCVDVPACDYPLMKVTLSWTDSDTTKSYLGETFTNGQSILICPDAYGKTCETTPQTTDTGYTYFMWRQQYYYKEIWRKSNANPFQGTGVQSYQYNKYERFVKTTGTSTVSVSTTKTDSAKDLKHYLYFLGAKLQRKKGTFSTIGPTSYNIFETANTNVKQRRNIQRGHSTGSNTSLPMYYQEYTYDKSGNLPQYTKPTSTDYRYRWKAAASKPPIDTLGAKDITDAYEGSFTTGGGITITWEKSNLGEPWGACT